MPHWGCPIALPDITLCKFWEWLAFIFGIPRSFPIMRKPLTRSHCKAMCYTKLTNCFGRVTAIGDIHVWEWLPVIFRMRRSSSIMLKPMRSHCKAMCYRKLANCFGRGTAIGGIHVSNKKRCSYRLKSRRLPRPRVLIRGSCAIGAACPIALPDITLCKSWGSKSGTAWEPSAISRPSLKGPQPRDVDALACAKEL